MPQVKSLPKLERKAIAAVFEDELISVTFDQLLMLKPVNEKVLKTRKYQQILASVREVGVIEPPVISRDPNSDGRYFLLDGHLRVSALKVLGIAEVTCLVARDDEAFTFNKYINRPATIQEHKMVRRAIDHGVCVEKLAAALDMDVKTITRKRNLLRGICYEAADILKDHIIAPATFQVLRKMQPLRQIEVATLMNDAGVYTKPYALALLAATPKDQLLNPEKPKKIKGLDEEQMVRMEAEMDSLQREYRLIEENYGRDVLNLTLAKGYLGALLNNVRVYRYLSTHEPDILKQFQQIADLNSISPQQVA